MKQRYASSGVQTIGSPRTLNDVLTMTGQPVACLNASSTWLGSTRRAHSSPRGFARCGGAACCSSVVPDYLKERAFFWDIDYTHNFVTTERRVRQLLYDGGLEIAATVRSIGAATGLRRDALAAGALLVNLPGVDAVSRWTRTEELLFRVRKNLFETLAFVARRPTRSVSTGWWATRCRPLARSRSVGRSCSAARPWCRRSWCTSSRWASRTRTTARGTWPRWC